LDTRIKIVQSFANPQLKTIIGYFDPMHAAHVRRLRELCPSGERINVILADPPEPILPAGARAELVAALTCVAEVAIGECATGSNLIDERAADSDRSRVFARHVLARHDTK
jgi:glycerol-3-phosphate cytidylyltransferase-like family protein